MFHPNNPIVLTAGALEAHIHPSCGGRIGRFFKRLEEEEFDFLMPLPEQPFDPDTWPKAGCFPMLPFADKLADNRLRWATYTVEVADPSGPPWFHGWGLRSSWDVVERTATECELRMRFEGSSRWPWPFAARLRFSLDASGLDVTLSMTNLAHVSAPAGIGLHPYLRWPAGTRTEVRGGGVWVADTLRPGSFHPYDRESADAWFAGDMSLPTSPPNLFYEAWDGFIRIQYANGQELHLASSLPATLTTFAPKNGAGYVCLEPGICLPGDFGSGLGPGAVQRVQMRLQAEVGSRRLAHLLHTHDPLFPRRL
jgi:aldose 1-epimerase